MVFQGENNNANNEEVDNLLIKSFFTFKEKKVNSDDMRRQ